MELKLKDSAELNHASINILILTTGGQMMSTYNYFTLETNLNQYLWF